MLSSCSMDGRAGEEYARTIPSSRHPRDRADTAASCLTVGLNAGNNILK